MYKNRCWIELSRSALAFNVAQIKKDIPEGTSCIAIVKADGYGHGAGNMVKMLQKNGINDFGVACTSELVNIREYSDDARVLVLGYVFEDDWPTVVANSGIMSIVSGEHALKLNEWAEKRGIILEVEVMVDTGMRRLGLLDYCDDQDIINAYSCSNLRVQGTFTHLCVSDSFAEKDREFTEVQNERYSNFVVRVRKLGFNPGRTHVCASAGMLNYPQFRYDYVRPGFLIYGYYVGEVERRIPVKPVMHMYSQIEHIKTVREGEGISYGRLYYTDGERRIATVTAGYADGYPRCITGKAHVLVHGQIVPVVGRICMDKMMIDVTGIPDVKVEDKVTLIGSDGDNSITIEDIADWADTVASEICCCIPERVKRFTVE